MKESLDKAECNLLTIERMVLESIGSTYKDFETLKDEVQLSAPLLKRVLFNLENKNFVKQDGKTQQYAVNTKNRFFNKLKESEDHEFFDLALAAVRQNSLVKLGLKKVWLVPEEEKTFQHMMRNIEIFLENVENKNIQQSHQVLSKQNRPIAQKKLIFWGHGRYCDFAHLA